MSTMRLMGWSLFAGFSLGQLFAGSIIHQECRNAPVLVALSTFGVGMSIYGLLVIFLRRKSFLSS